MTYLVVDGHFGNNNALQMARQVNLHIISKLRHEDLRGLEFLNSSGINVLFRLVIKVREKANMQLIVRGANHVSWQSKSLVNLQRLMPTVQLNWE